MELFAFKSPIIIENVYKAIFEEKIRT
jgi:hypothetical protein